MKRLFYVIVAVAMMAFATSASAQGYGRPHGHRGYHDFYSITSGMGVSAGYVHSIYRLSDWATDDVDTVNGLNGFNIGLTKDFMIYEHMLALQTGLVYTYQNESKNMTEAGVRIIGDWDEHFLSIPVKIKYEYPIMDNVCVFAMAGPTLVAGLSSSMKYRASVGDSVNAAISYNMYNGKIRSNDAMPEALTQFISSQFPGSRYRWPDIQFGLSAGAVLFELLELQIGYDWGVVNKYRDENIDDVKMRRQQLYITAGVRF